MTPERYDITNRLSGFTASIMDEDRDYPSRPVPSISVLDNIGLLSSKGSPGLVTTTSAIEPLSYYRGRHSRDNSGDGRLRSIDESESLRDFDSHGLVEPPTPTKARRLSSGPSSASSVLRRLTTKYSPISRSNFRSTKRAQGRQYATLDDGDVGQGAAVDLSSLEGMGWELTDMSNSDTARLRAEETEYVRPNNAGKKPDFRAFVEKRKSVGDGMRDITVQLRRDPTRLVRRSTGGSRNAESTGIDRSKTVKVFQNLAQEKNAIVQIEEAVDLSSLEGGHTDHCGSQAVETMSMRQSVMPQETKSYFFPEDPEIPNWKPWSMSSIYILALMALALGLAGFQELLCQRSLRSVRERSGILAFDEVAEISTWDFFAWKCKLWQN